MLLPNFSRVGPAVWPEKSKYETDGQTDGAHDVNTLSGIPIPDKLKMQSYQQPTELGLVQMGLVC